MGSVESAIEQLDQIRSDLAKLAAEMEQREEVAEALHEAERQVGRAYSRLSDEASGRRPITP